MQEDGFSIDAQKCTIVIKANKEKIAGQKKELAILKRQIENTVNLLIDMPSENLKTRLKSLEAQAKQLEDSIKFNSVRFNELAFNPENMERYFNDLKDFENLTRDKQKMIIEHYIEFIEVIPLNDSSKDYEVLVKTVLDNILMLGKEKSLRNLRKDTMAG